MDDIWLLSFETLERLLRHRPQNIQQKSRSYERELLEIDAPDKDKTAASDITMYYPPRLPQIGMIGLLVAWFHFTMKF